MQEMASPLPWQCAADRARGAAHQERFLAGLLSVLIETCVRKGRLVHGIHLC